MERKSADCSSFFGFIAILMDNIRFPPPMEWFLQFPRNAGYQQLEFGVIKPQVSILI
ncbi:hypothetical protein [Dyadobacter sp. CY343]|uniref:hypothetical protein n=1 Tax=Dyadobacter sp. CY343 TaxID=2907299 RepID=UPI001F168304|nr:hypothetical protein [Dyadobacter sp. CY343]MCE7058503.1 hypothetical protein [Dyadobacter sp. CY343]